MYYHLYLYDVRVYYLLYLYDVPIYLEAGDIIFILSSQPLRLRSELAWTVELVGRKGSWRSFSLTSMLWLQCSQQHFCQGLIQLMSGCFLGQAVQPVRDRSLTVGLGEPFSDKAKLESIWALTAEKSGFKSRLYHSLAGQMINLSQSPYTHVWN